MDIKSGVVPGYPALDGLQPSSPPRRHRARPARLAARGLAAVLLITGGIAADQHLAGSGGGGVPSSALSQLDTAIAHASPVKSTAASADPASLARRVVPGLVDVNTTLSYQGARAAGTGMVLTSNGLVLTNNHVIEAATSISVTDLGNGRTYPARVLGYDRTHDVALLKLTEAAGLPTVPLAGGGQVGVGQQVVAIGNAGGTGTPSVAAGTVTGLHRSITAQDASGGTSERLSGLIETDANVQPGDSGGPLVDAAGQVIGMDTAASAGYQLPASGTSATGGATSGGGQGFAVPIGQALATARQVAAGHVSATVHVGPTAFLGVEVGRPGATITGVLRGGPADAAGLAPGDTITSVDGHPVTSATGLTDRMLTEKPGASVTVGYLDQTGTPRTTTVRLASGPAQ